MTEEGGTPAVLVQVVPPRYLADGQVERTHPGQPLCYGILGLDQEITGSWEL